MKTIREIAASHSLIVTLVITFLTYSMSFGGNSIWSGVVIGDYSGEELFKSFLFMDGKATDSMPAINNKFDINDIFKDAQSLAEYRELQERTIAGIKKENSSFFTQFAASMYSNDVVKIKSALNKASNILAAQVNKELEKEGYTYDITVRNQQDVDELRVEYDKYINSNDKSPSSIILAFGLFVIVAIFFYVFIISEWFFWSAQIASGDENIFIDELALSVKQNL